MMRVLVLGTSHAAAFRTALPAISARHPDLLPAVWALPGGGFGDARTAPDGRLAPAPGDAGMRRKALAWNGCADIDLSAFDRIFLVGLRFALRQVLLLLGAVHLPGHTAEGGACLPGMALSLPMLRDGIDALVLPAVGAMSVQLGAARVTALPAPYPARRATDPGAPGYEPALARVAAHPQAGTLMALLHDRLALALAARGHVFCPQPAVTLAGPFVSRDALRLARPPGDLRHLNADYAATAFDALLSAGSPPAAWPAARSDLSPTTAPR